MEIPITIGLAGLKTYGLTGVQDPNITTFKHYPNPCTKRDIYSTYQQIRRLTKSKVSLLPVLRNINLDHNPKCSFSDIHSNDILTFSNKRGFTESVVTRQTDVTVRLGALLCHTTTKRMVSWWLGLVCFLTCYQNKNREDFSLLLVSEGLVDSP